MLFRSDDWVLISIANGANKFHRIHRYDNYGPAWRLVAALDRLQTRGMVQRDPEDGWHLTDIGWQALGFDTLWGYLDKARQVIAEQAEELKACTESIAHLRASQTRHRPATTAIMPRIDDDLTVLMAAVVEEPRPPMGFHPGGAR